jgi:hypothetical protein
MSARQVSDIVVRFYPKLEFPYRFPYKSPVSICTKKRLWGATLMHGDRQTARHDQANRRCSLFMQKRRRCIYMNKLIFSFSVYGFPVYKDPNKYTHYAIFYNIIFYTVIELTKICYIMSAFYWIFMSN